MLVNGEEVSADDLATTFENIGKFLAKLSPEGDGVNLTIQLTDGEVMLLVNRFFKLYGIGVGRALATIITGAVDPNRNGPLIRYTYDPDRLIFSTDPRKVESSVKARMPARAPTAARIPSMAC